MSVGHEPITSFDQWYVDYNPAGRGDVLEYRTMTPCADSLYREYSDFKREMDARVGGYAVLEKLADAEVISPKPDLPNVSSGEMAGLVRRTARSLVQNTPNVEVVSCYDDDDVRGIFAKHILTSKIIGSDRNSADMQQNLFASTKTAFTLGFACVIPVLLQDAGGGWYMKYDTIHYRDVFPEPGCKDVRDSTVAYVRRYLTRGEVHSLIRTNAAGWDTAALKLLCSVKPPARESQSVDHQRSKHRQVPDGYEIITRYDSTGDNFLTFHATTKILLRIEKNKHPLKLHPVHFLVLEKDENQPLGKSQVELGVGRQDFQDLMLNGAMKLWYRNINPSIIGYGGGNAIPNLSPGKYTAISNPNAKVEAFEVNTQTLMQYGQISEQNLGSLVNLIGAPDQQMQQQAGHGMSATPQGVDAQAQVVDVTTNNFQKAIESFFGHYCSYALTTYFAELAAVKTVTLTADARTKLVEAGLPIEEIKDEKLEIDFAEMVKEYWVRCVPGSLVEMEDEKQLRILNQLFVPLSQAMPAMAATQDTEALHNASKAMSYIIARQIELSGSASAKDIGLLWTTGNTTEVEGHDEARHELEDRINGLTMEQELHLELQSGAISALQEQISLMAQNQQLLLEKLGVLDQPSEPSSPTSPEVVPSGV